MSQSIGRAALILSTNYSQLTGGLSKAKGAAVSGMKGIASAATSALGSFAKGGLMGAGMAAFNKITEAVADPFERLDELAKTASTARTFGIDPSEFSAISGVLKSVGSDLRDQTESLITMSTLGRNAAAGTQEAAAAFKSLNLNAAEFNQLGVVDQFYAAYDALSKMSDPKLRNSAAGKLFGEDGMKNVVPLIGKSADEIKRMGEAFRKSNADLAAAEQANKSLKAAQLSVSAAWDKIILAAAPAVELLGSVIPPAIERLTTLFSGWGDSTMPVLRGIVVGFGYVADAVQAFWDLAKASIGGTIEMLGHVVAGIEEVTGKSSVWGAAMKEVGGDMAKKGIEGLGNFGTNAQAARDFFDGWKAKRDDALRTPVKGPPINVPAKLDVVAMKYSATNALVQGTREELSARIRAEVGATTVDEKQLAEQRKGNVILGLVKTGIEKVAARLGPMEAI